MLFEYHQSKKSYESDVHAQIGDFPRYKWVVSLRIVETYRRLGAASSWLQVDTYGPDYLQPDFRCGAGWSPLDTSSSQGSPEVVLVLPNDERVRLDALPDNRSSLSLASINGNALVVRFF